jgi:hypothetical protein
MWLCYPHRLYALVWYECRRHQVRVFETVCDGEYESLVELPGVLGWPRRGGCGCTPVVTLYRPRFRNPSILMQTVGAAGMVTAPVRCSTAGSPLLG